jgi:hypothetical protein
LGSNVIVVVSCSALFHRGIHYSHFISKSDYSNNNARRYKKL